MGENKARKARPGYIARSDTVTGRPGVSTAKVGLGRNGPVRRATEFALVHPHGQWVASQLATGPIMDDAYDPKYLLKVVVKASSAKFMSG